MDWENTTAWGWGGYYARIFVNVEGREPRGIVPPSEYERTRDDLIARIEGIPDMDGRSMDNFVFRPEQVYKVTNGDYPDLMVFLDERGVASRPYFNPLHLQPLYRERLGHGPGDFPVTERIAASTLALPWSSLLGDEDVAYVAEMLEAGIREQSGS